MRLSALGDATHATFTVRTRLDINGHKPLSLTEHFYTSKGVLRPLTLYTRGTECETCTLD